MGGRDFTAIEHRFTMVLDALSEELSASERREVEEFIDVGEYGIALETLGALLVEERKRISPATFAEIVELADSMGIRATAITDGLRRRVIPELGVRMDVTENRIHLSKTHLKYLRQCSFLPTSLAKILEAVKFEGDVVGDIRVSREVAEEFRSVLTDQLAKVGFNADYEPTSEGRILEELIDRFFLRNC